MYTKDEVLTYVRENDVKFIRMAFCDMLGNQKNISIMPSALPAAFEGGIPIDASSIIGFGDVVDSDIFLVPDPDTLSVLPWRPQQGRVVRFFCNIRDSKGNTFTYDVRSSLMDTINRAKDMGISLRVGAECEFYLFEDGEDEANPYDNASYCDIYPLDKCENIRREVCLTLENMGIKPESSHHEHGPGQNEIDFEASNPLKAADDIQTFKSVVSVVASKNGLRASFDPKPIKSAPGNGMHLNLSLYKDGRNVFDIDDKKSRSFVAGIIKMIGDITAFLNPDEDSYARFGNFEAPKYISWAKSNRSQLIRIPAASGDRKRFELRSPDPLANPYIAIKMIIEAGLYGIGHELELSSDLDVNLFKEREETLKNLELLPESLDVAILRACESTFVREVLSNEFLMAYIHSIS